MTEENKPGPLAGIRVIDLTQFVLGPLATQTLGDLGADVIKIEEPSGDRQRRDMGKVAPAAGMSAPFVGFNRNKRSVVLDLKTPGGKESLLALVATADVFIHNMRPASVERLGFGYEAVKAAKPDIVYVVAMGFGTDGPYAGRQAFDDLIQGASGTCDMLPLYDGDPTLRPMPSLLADKTCGLYAVIAAQAALLHRARTGEGQYVEVPMLECFTGFMLAEQLNGKAFLPERGKFGHPTTVTRHRRPVKTKDGHIVVMPADQAGSKRFLELGGFPDPYNSERYLNAGDSRARVATYYAMIEEAAMTRTTEEWLAICEEIAVPAMRANRLDEVFDDPHLKSVGFFEERTLPGEAGRYRALRPGLKFSKTPASIRRDPPALGQDTQAVLAELN